MGRQVVISENGLHMAIHVTSGGDVRLCGFSPLPLGSADQLPEMDADRFRIVELHVTGENANDHRGQKNTGTCPGHGLTYQTHRDYRTSVGRKLEIEMEHDGLSAVVHYQFYDDVPVVRAWTEVTNGGKNPKGLEYVTSFCLTGVDRGGIEPWDKKSTVHIPHNTWSGELQWRKYRVHELGLRRVSNVPFSLKRIHCSNTGTWSSSEHLPMGCYENTESRTSFAWQIENNGSWYWEIGETDGRLYLHLSGPTERESHWWKKLEPGESFASVPVAVVAVSGGFEEAMQALTMYRRKMRRQSDDNVKLPVIFNDYMNCLMGQPTTEKLIPLIDAAAEVGCEYFCIDAGWYSDGVWWDGVGEWIPARGRFPGGIEEPLAYVRKKGMIPGLWLEIEAMGISCPLADQVPDDWFFRRHGRRVVENSRLQLDFRHPGVVEHANQVIDRLVNKYGIGYIKMDYNVEFGPGTEVNSDSYGDGLLEHNRAYLKWLDSVFERYPGLVIENCGSGGCRMDYAMLSRHSIQSTSDNLDYLQYAAIAAASPTAVTPEQGACWSYPLTEGDREEVVFNMVSAMLMRIHQSGHLAALDDERLACVKEGIAYYKTMRQDIPSSLPIWPLGLPEFGDGWISLGLHNDDKVYLAVWRLEDPSDTCELPINCFRGRSVSVACAYPSGGPCEWFWHQHRGVLSVRLPLQKSARILKLSLKR